MLPLRRVADSFIIHHHMGGGCFCTLCVRVPQAWFTNKHNHFSAININVSEPFYESNSSLVVALSLSGNAVRCTNTLQAVAVAVSAATGAPLAFLLQAAPLRAALSLLLVLTDPVASHSQ